MAAQTQLTEALHEMVTWHRGLYDGLRAGKHQPTWEDFADSLAVLAGMHAVIEELIAQELRLSQRFATWAEIGRKLQMTRQGVQQMARSGRTSNNLTRLQNEEGRLLSARSRLQQRRRATVVRRAGKGGPLRRDGWASSLPFCEQVIKEIAEQRIQTDELRLAMRESQRFEALRERDAQRRMQQARNAQERRLRDKAAFAATPQGRYEALRRKQKADERRTALRGLLGPAENTDS